jgi:bifunctional non-homologous end joining protein LigD
MAVDPLGLYNAKRDFKKTAEPRGRRAKSSGNSFVVQKHDATRLHWDFRLEIDGVLKSWAVTRGPSLDPADKRLAVRTEDHPLEYGTFEGTIPKGEYGGGTVMLWDRGTWAPIAGKSAKDLEEGHLHFSLDGERMKGEWLLIRIKGKPKEKRENWLLRKIDDSHAGASGDLVDRCLTSVATGRTMDDIAAGKPGPKAKPTKSARKGRPPAFEAVQLATLVDHVPDGGDWIHETKYDGYRALVAVGGGQAKVYTRSGLDWSEKFAGVVDAAAVLDVDEALIDGEIVMLDADGRPSFGELQEAIKARRRDMLFFAFDLLRLNGTDLKKRSNIERKERLRTIIPADGPIAYAEHIVGSGEPLLKAMCEAGLEGIVSKRADAPYVGKRAQAWLKVKCVQRAEYVIVGWTESSAARRGLGALLMAAREGASLRYAGKVGTGYTEATMQELRAKLDPIATDKAAVHVPREARRGAHYVKPELVAEIAYGALTNDGILRHASFVGLRGDKKASEVRFERPVPVPAATPVKISNRDRVIFPESDITKGELADYYQAMSALVLRTVAGRPLSLVRCPQGRAKQCFFQRHGAENLGESIRTVNVLGKDGNTRAYLYIEDATGLIETVQMGAIELHGWGALADDIERPDRLIFDLDPDEGLNFDAVREAAVDLKQKLSDLGLVSFPMLSGGKGVHVVVPLTPRAEWPEVTDFAHRFAAALAAADPERYTATMSKAKRKGRIFIDWLRNQRGSTAIMPYSVRARPNAPVASPIAWSEIGSVSGGGQFTLKDRAVLIGRAGSELLKGWGIAEQPLPDY